MCLTQTNLSQHLSISWQTLLFQLVKFRGYSQRYNYGKSAHFSLGSSLFSISRLIVILLCYNYKILGDEFEKCVGHNDVVQQTVRRVDRLRSVVELGNDCANNLVLSLYIGFLSYLAYIPALQFEKTRLVKRWYLVASYSIFGIFLLIACDLPTRVCTCVPLL